MADTLPTDCATLLQELKDQIRVARVKARLAVNGELVHESFRPTTRCAQ